VRMGPDYEEFYLTDSAYRHGYDEEDVAELLRGRHLIFRSRRGRQFGYEFLGRNQAGEYLLVVGRVVQSQGRRILRVFHIDRMPDADRKRFLRQTGL
jgi:hypothetical protein